MDYESIELKRLYLIAPERRKGLGQLLLKRALVYAQNANYRRMRLETTSGLKQRLRFIKKPVFMNWMAPPP